MKKTKTIIILVILSLTANLNYCQNPDWNDFELDSIVSFKAPFKELYKMDTITQGLEIYQLYSTSENNSTFIVQKSKLESDYISKELSRLPYNLKSLNKYYMELSKGMISNSGYKLLKRNETNNNGYHSYSLTLSDKNDNTVYYSQFMIIDKYLYNFIYTNNLNFSKEELESFFNSINIRSNKKLGQFRGKSKGYRQGYIFGKISFYIILIIGLIILIRNMKKKKRNAYKTL